MELRFDSGQQFQVNAVESIARLFDGQGRIETSMRYVREAGGFVASPNRLGLTDSALLRNLQETQKLNGITPSSSLEDGWIEQEIETAEGRRTVKFPNFSVEMETGTGKTYVYIRTALELNRRYGFRRFIIVVPSIAIKEGVTKTFEITRKHFQELYGNLPYKFYPYDSANLTQVRQFSASPNVEFMIMTLDSFNKAMTAEGKGNVIRRSTDRLQGATPIHIVQASRPILVLDEPQNMESEKSIAALAALNPLLALRYSATHRRPYNLVYRLTPAEAYRDGLVKKIEVASVLKESDANLPYIRVNSILTKGHTLAASLTVNKLMKSGAVKQTEIRVKSGDNLRPKTNLPEYEEFVVDEISTSRVVFGNGIELAVGGSQGADKEALFEAQIRYTVEEHFRKQRRLRDRGIKVLSLFFVDRVDNYASPEGIIRRYFTQAFNELRKNYSDWADLTAEEVQASYFAFTKKKGGQVELEDSASGESKKDEEAYDLIMKDKERLLSFGTKEAFIFSHSALREGWDNPNVFQICTLHQTTSEIRKRQEVGRGVRLAVTQTGERAHDPEVNVLTVVANQSYEDYVRQLQEEIREEYGEGVELPPKPPNARRAVTVLLRKEYLLKPEFKELWEKIKRRTRYYVTIDSERVVREAVAEVDKLQIRTPKIVISKAELRIDDDGDFEAYLESKAKTVLDLAGRYPLPNLVELMEYLLEHTTPQVRLSRKTLVEIFLRTANKKAAIDNPFEFASEVVRVLKEQLADHLVNGIQYEKIEDWYEMSRLDAQIAPAWEGYVVPAEHSVYDHVLFDSEIERKFVEDLERMREVKMYIKLPSWFEVDTPVGKYNPDWAIVWEWRDTHGELAGKPLLYLVSETKGATIDKLRSDERRKVLCGEKHFEGALGTRYKLVQNASELP